MMQHPSRVLDTMQAMLTTNLSVIDGTLKLLLKEFIHQMAATNANKMRFVQQKTSAARPHTITKMVTTPTVTTPKSQ